MQTYHFNHGYKILHIIKEHKNSHEISYSAANWKVLVKICLMSFSNSGTASAAILSSL